MKSRQPIMCRMIEQQAKMGTPLITEKRFPMILIILIAALLNVCESLRTEFKSLNMLL